MNPYYSYLLGFFTILILIFPFWVLSMYNYIISDIYLTFVCSSAFTYPK